ncbi:hypothetical protein N7488_011409 [Penicillium malachiteum]|nr:hypothetical protein N7488_011409 [Penicillium malachiteum]
MHQSPFAVFALLSSFLAETSAKTICKTSPNEASWSSFNEWQGLNQSIQGALIKTAPAPSSCYPGNPFDAATNCTDVTENWSYAAYHAAWPESVDYSVWTNNSCLPPGHDLSGRYTGAFSLSIWTHNLNHFEYKPAWSLPNGNGTESVAVCGSGLNWGTVYNAMRVHNRTVNGGHGLLSSHYGLASDQLYQVTIITPDGKRHVANSVQNTDLFWAVRGGGGGQFGVVTEFVLKTYPAPENVVAGGLAFYPSKGSNNSDRSWEAFAEVVSLIPDLMDFGYAGNIIAATGQSAAMVIGSSGIDNGVAVTISLVAYNMTTGVMNATISRLQSRISNASHSHDLQFVPSAPSVSGYWDYIKPNFLSSASCGVSSLMSSCLLGRAELSDLPKADLTTYLQKASISKSGTGSMLLFGLQAGRGPANVPEEMRGSVLPAWRSAYAHMMSFGASYNSTLEPSEGIADQADWIEQNLEPVWRNWAPDSGSYMNEGNVFSSTWKQDFYGVNYDRLLDIKNKYDPSGTLFVWAGVGSDMWNYDMQTGLLCHA